VVGGKENKMNSCDNFRLIRYNVIS